MRRSLLIILTVQTKSLLKINKGGPQSAALNIAEKGHIVVTQVSRFANLKLPPFELS